MVAEYFIVKRWRTDLDESRVRGVLPAAAPGWVPATLIIWLVSAVLGYVVTWGIPPLLSLATSMVLYIIAGKLGWVRGLGHAPTRLRAAAEATAPDETAAPRSA